MGSISPLWKSPPRWVIRIKSLTSRNRESDILCPRVDALRRGFVSSMRRPILPILTSVLMIMGLRLRNALAADPDVASQVVSYGYLESAAEAPDQPNVLSSLVSYGY